MCEYLSTFIECPHIISYIEKLEHKFYHLVFLRHFNTLCKIYGQLLEIFLCYQQRLWGREYSLLIRTCGPNCSSLANHSRHIYNYFLILCIFLVNILKLENSNSKQFFAIGILMFWHHNELLKIFRFAL